MPLFTVVIPTYNRAGFIVETINSVLAQTDADFEVVVVDDGSTDDTQNVVRRDFGQLEKVRYVRQANAERGAARNRGIREARGRFVIFLDSDDFMRPDHLSTLREIIEERPGVNYLATKYEFIRDGQISSAGLEGIREGEYGTDFFLRGDPIGSVFCVRKDNPNLKLFEEDRCYATSEDWMFLLQNLTEDKIFIRDRATMLVNDHDQRSMRSDNREVIKRKLLALEWIKQNVPLTASQIKILEGHTHYFCAIHSYLDNNRGDAFRHIFRSLKRGGASLPLGVLFIKSLLGRGFVRKLAGRGRRQGASAPAN
ncbi:MAG TPA: glycosyltransferase family A protein [Pyrinomonadaceae bacterium]|nr:glycosyltransferase family A protein [Pyrinomonadaceae bacterium]